MLLGSSASFATNYKGDYKGEAAPVVVAPVCDTLKDGAYIGLEAGYNSASTRLGISNNTAAGIVATAPGTAIVANPTIAAGGWDGSLMLGFGQYFGNATFMGNAFYLGGEIYARTNGTGSTTNYTAKGTAGNTLNVSTRTSMGTRYGIAILPGFKLNNASLLYARLGYDNANLSGSSTINVVNSSNVVLGSASGSSSKWRSGWSYGLGMETLVYQNFSVRGDYTRVNYNNFNINNVKISPSDNRFGLGLIYHFA
jgi:opacity protein-like surface antigen